MEIIKLYRLRHKPTGCYARKGKRAESYSTKIGDFYTSLGHLTNKVKALKNPEDWEIEYHQPILMNTRPVLELFEGKL